MLQTIKGIVIHGDGYGKKLGFPTVNLEIDTTEATTEALPPYGVYAGVAILDKKEYRAGIIIGPAEKVEAHLIGYEGDAYGKEVVLDLEKFLREFKKFDTEAELIIQIENDLKMC